MDVGAWGISPEKLSYITSKYLFKQIKKNRFFQEKSGAEKF